MQRTKITINHLSPLHSFHPKLYYPSNKRLIRIFFTQRTQRTERDRAKAATTISNLEKFQFIFPTTKDYHTRVFFFFFFLPRREQRLFEVITDIWHRFSRRSFLICRNFSPGIPVTDLANKSCFFHRRPAPTREKLSACAAPR